ncbi:MAG: GDSL-type esterase/lipase family protein [Candidatus Limnocylindria bacterium]
MLAFTSRRSLRTALISALVAAALGAPVSAAPPNTVYLALGDSLAWGDGASDPSETAYVPLLADYFAGTPHGGAKQLSNLAVRGETTASFIAGGQLSAAIAAISDPATDIRVVTLALGGNDLLDLLNDASDPCRTNPASLECQALVAAALAGVANRYPIILGGLIGALAGDPGEERIYVMTVYNAFGGTESQFELPVDFVLLGADLTIDCTALGNPANAGLNDVIGCTSLLAGATVVDAYPVIGDNALALTHIGEPVFNIHPNDGGYALLAKAHRKA